MVPSRDEHRGLARPDGPTVFIQLCLFVLSVFFYMGVPSLQGEPRASGLFMQLADAFVDGHLSIANPRPHAGELIPSTTEGRFFCPYPPLPAVLLMPFALFGVTLPVAFACRAVSVANVLLFDSCLRRVPALFGRGAPEPGPRVAMNLLFAFGTVTWHNAEMGGDWHLAHAVALCAMLLALREFAGRRRFGIVGCFAALAILTRPTTALLSVFFGIPCLSDTPRDRRVSMAKLVAAPAAAVLLLAIYNQFRFGSPTDFGYDRMILVGRGKQLLEAYGQFHPHFIPVNFYWFFLAPPVALEGGRFPYLGYDPYGLSLFIATPAFLYAFVGIRRHWGLPVIRHAVVGIALCLVPLILYFNTGFWQFGQRFSMDYLPLLMLLVVAGVGPRPGRLAYALICASIVINTVGVILDPVVAPDPY